MAYTFKLLHWHIKVSSNAIDLQENADVAIRLIPNQYEVFRADHVLTIKYDSISSCPLAFRLEKYLFYGKS